MGTVAANIRTPLPDSGHTARNDPDELRALLRAEGRVFVRADRVRVIACIHEPQITVESRALCLTGGFEAVDQKDSR